MTPPPHPLEPSIRAGHLYVTACAGHDIVIICRDGGPGEQFLKARGYHSQSPNTGQSAAAGGSFTLPVADDSAKAQELSWLRDHGIPFSVGKEWNPTEIFQYLRDLALLDGGYWSISWSRPGQFTLRWNE